MLLVNAQGGLMKVDDKTSNNYSLCLYFSYLEATCGIYCTQKGKLKICKFQYTFVITTCSKCIFIKISELQISLIYFMTRICYFN